jgi:hypothetical protein
MMMRISQQPITIVSEAERLDDLPENESGDDDKSQAEAVDSDSDFEMKCDSEAGDEIQMRKS